VTRKTESDPGAQRAGAAIGFAAGGIVGAAIGASIGGATGTRTKRVEKEERLVTLDLVSLQPPRRFRIEMGGFNFQVLGPEVQPSTRENIRRLLAKLIAWCPHVRTTTTPEELYAPGRFHTAQFDSERDFEARLEWMLNCALHAPQA
jgi:hypothetical protein